MESLNQTSGFILAGFSDIPQLRALFFSLFLIIYITTLSGNILLIVVVRINTQLQTPMYFFLSNLSSIDICFSSSVVPKILVNTISGDRSISVPGCVAQMFISLAMGATECLILAVMAYDRYVAICNPLHYITVMNNKICICLATASWTAGFINSVIHVFITFQLPFCKSHHVNHFFCEVPPFFKLSCTDTWFNELGMYISAVLIVMCAFFVTIISYVYIISTILKIQSSQGRYKAFSTCTSHLTAVSLYYGTIMFMYMRPRSRNSPKTDRTLSILYTAVIPMLNPIIYSIRNKDVKGTIKNKLTSVPFHHYTEPLLSQTPFTYGVSATIPQGNIDHHPSEMHYPKTNCCNEKGFICPYKDTTLPQVSLTSANLQSATKEYEVLERPLASEIQNCYKIRLFTSRGSTCCESLPKTIQTRRDWS
ncbi:olfactory receptor 2G6-like [Discoglossus pictus]